MTDHEIEIRLARDAVTAGLDAYSDGLAVQIDGNDLVHLTNVGDCGTALLTVFASSHSKAAPIWQGTINLAAHREEEAPSC